MAWYWTDDLARALIDASVAPRERLQGWLERPVAHAGPDEATALEIALLLLEPERSDHVA